MSAELLRAFLSDLLSPMPLLFILAVISLLWLWCSRRAARGKVAVTGVLLLLFALSFKPLPYALMHHLEYQYPPLKRLPNHITWVVVLGGGHSNEAQLASYNRLNQASLARLVTGMALARQQEKTKLLLSGGGASRRKSDAYIMKQSAIALGFEQQCITLETISDNTWQQARAVKRILGKQRFVLVTSANHMPRTMALFHKQGMHPIAAPSNYLTKSSSKVGLEPLLPSYTNLLLTTSVMHEYIGYLWSLLQGQV